MAHFQPHTSKRCLLLVSYLVRRGINTVAHSCLGGFTLPWEAFWFRLLWPRFFGEFS